MSNQLQITGGAKVRNLDGVITGSTGVLSSLPINGSNGIPQLDSSGKILVSQLPNSVMEYKGMWNVTTNSPYLVNGVGNAGDVYLVMGAATGGTSHDFGAGAITFFNGDQVIYDGTNWDRATGSTGTVTSVAVTMPSAFSVSGSPITTSGTIAISGAGTTSQYINGAGGLTTFPSLTGYVPYSGATNDVDLGTHKLSLYSEQFASISAPTYSEGALWYDSTQKALAYYNDVTNNILHIGQEVQLKVHNNTGSTIAKGAPVYVTSTSSGYSYPNVALAKADTLTTANVIGLANQSIPNGTDGYITLSGLLTGANTGTFTVGDVLYLSPYSAGQLMNTVPPTGYAVRIGVVSYSNTPNGTIYINQSNAYSTAANIVGTIQISQGGTGATTAGGALTNLGAAPLSRLISTTSPLQGGGDLSADRTLSILQAGTSQSGYLSSTDWNTFNNKQNALTNAVTGTGVSGQVSYFNGTSTITGSNNYFWDATNNRLGIGLTNPQRSLEIYSATADSHLRLSGSAPTVSMGEAITGSIYQAKFGLVTANGQFYTSAVPGDFVMISQTGATIFGNAGGERMRLNTNGTFSIGNTNSSFNLDVTGTGRFTGQLTLGSTITNGLYTYTLPSATGTLALTSSLSSYVPTSRTLSINGTSYDLSADRAWTINSMVYPGAGIAVSTGTAWGTSIVDNSTNWNTAYSSRITSVSSPLSFISNVLSISKSDDIRDGYLSSADWTLFNNKQNALTNPVTGTGTTNYVPKFTGTSTIGNSILQDNGNIGVGYTPNTWYTGYKVLEMGSGSLVFPNNATNTQLWNNLYINAAGNTTYKSTGIGGLFSLGGGGNAAVWYSAVSGTAGTTASLSQIMTLTNSGSLALNSSSPSFPAGNGLYVSDASRSNLSLTDGTNTFNIWQSGANAAFNMLSSGDILFRTTTGNTERLRITSGGNVGIGTSSPSYTLDVTGTGRFTGTLNVGNVSATGTITMNGTANGANLIGPTGNPAYYSVDQSVNNGGKRWRFGHTGAVSGFSSFDFYNQTDNITAMTILSSGNVGIGTTAPTDALTVVGGIKSYGASSGLFMSDRGSLGTSVGFYTSGTMNVYTTAVGTIGTFNTSSGTYTAISDSAKKKDFELSTIGLNEVLKLKPTLYRMKDEDESVPKTLGFIAQEVKPIIPQAYVESDDFIGLNDRPIIAALVKAIQELKAEIDELKNK